MRNLSRLITLSIFAATPAMALLNIPSDGSDGVLNVTSNTVIDLNQAVSGVWSNNNTANAGKGIYDSNLWAVVFKYRSVSIVATSTVTFQNHASRAPVVWLVQTNVAVYGGINLTGQRVGIAVTTNLEPGPGGFRSGALGIPPLGPGGNVASSAVYRSSYGNPQILPLIGGSGLSEPSQVSYAAGGGAILIAAANTITNNGIIQSKGAGGTLLYASGGGIRLVAESIQGNGTVDVNPEGRLRIEANTIAGTLNFQPAAAAVPPGATPVIWPPANTPSCSIVSIGNVPAPGDPRADYINQPDVAVFTNGPVDVILQTANFPTSGVVQVRVAVKNATNAYWVGASCISGTVVSATWKATMSLTNAMTVLQARATSQ